MVLTRPSAGLAIAMAATLALAVPSTAHENHQREQLDAAERVDLGRGTTPDAIQKRLEDRAEAIEAQRPQTFTWRLISWVGRIHPFAVHFPIALFPVALIALILARRRGETVTLIRSLIIVAGAASVVAGVLGWFTGGFLLVDRDPVQLWHRWIGTGLAAAGLVLAVWASRRRDATDSMTMVAALAFMTLVLLVQAWLGAALVHGLNHMAF